MASSISKSFPRLETVKSGLAAAICLGLLHPLHADLNSSATPNVKRRNVPTGSSQPTAVADVATAEVSRAGEVTVRLRGIARGGGQVEFMLMQKPRHGRVISSKVVGLDSMDVVYRQSGDQSSDTDSFIFAVRAGGIGPFSPGEAKITIKDQPGRLLVPEAMNFPATLVGQTAADEFVVVNEGGATLSGKIIVPAPWQLKDAAAYYLNPGEKRKITLLFVPKTSGSFSGQLIFEGSKSSSVELQGDGLGTFLASPAKLKLLPMADGKRGGTISLQNNTDAAVNIEIESPLKLPKTVFLQFGEVREIPVPDDGIGLLSTYVILKNGAYSTRVDVSAEETPTSLAAQPAPSATPALLASVAVAAPTPILVAAAAIPEVEQETVEAPAATPRVAVVMPYINAKIVRLSRSSVRVDWTLPAQSPDGKIEIKQRYLRLDQAKKLTTEWVDVPWTPMGANGREGSARIDDLDARDVFTFRVSQTAGGASPALLSLPLIYETEPTFFQQLTWRSLLYPLGAILLGLVIRNRWQQRTIRA